MLLPPPLKAALRVGVYMPQGAVWVRGGAYRAGSQGKRRLQSWAQGLYAPGRRVGAYLVIHQICNYLFGDNIGDQVQNLLPRQHTAAQTYHQYRTSRPLNDILVAS